MATRLGLLIVATAAGILALPFLALVEGSGQIGEVTACGSRKAWWAHSAAGRSSQPAAACGAGNDNRHSAYWSPLPAIAAAPQIDPCGAIPIAGMNSIGGTKSGRYNGGSA